MQRIEEGDRIKPTRRRGEAMIVAMRMFDIPLIDQIGN